MLACPCGVSRALVSLVLFNDLQSEHVSLPGKRFWLPRINSGLCSDGVALIPPAPCSSQYPHPLLVGSFHLPTPSPLPGLHPISYSPAQHPCSKPSAHPPSSLLQEGKTEVFVHQPGPHGHMVLQGTGWAL